MKQGKYDFIVLLIRSLLGFRKRPVPLLDEENPSVCFQFP